MKKAFFLLFCWGTLVSIYSQQYVSLTKEQSIPQIGLINRTIPVYMLKEKIPGAISVTDAYYIVTGNEKAGPYDDCDCPVFFPGGKTVAYNAKIDGKWFVFSGNEKAGPHDNCGFLPFSPHWRTAAHSAIINGQWYVITGNEKAGPYHELAGLDLSPDGKIVTYKAETDDQWYSKLLADGKEYTGSKTPGSDQIITVL